MSDPTIVNPANNVVSNDAPISTGELPYETPPPPEADGFRDKLIEAEQARRERQDEWGAERRAATARRYKGIESDGDQPGSALANDSAKTVTGDAATPTIRDGRTPQSPA